MIEIHLSAGTIFIQIATENRGEFFEFIAEGPFGENRNAIGEGNVCKAVVILIPAGIHIIEAGGDEACGFARRDLTTDLGIGLGIRGGAHITEELRDVLRILCDDINDTRHSI